MAGVQHDNEINSKDKVAKNNIKVFETDTIVSKELCNDITQIANQSIKERGKFVVGLSGGSLAKYINTCLPKANTDWSRWRIYFCDERHVPHTDPECTYNVYKQGLFSKVNISVDHVFPDNPDVSVEEAAKQYECKLKAEFPGADLPAFDLLLLGMGPDGHTCSLFPGHPLMKESSCWVAPISDSPKPPSQRITLTLPVLNNARIVIFTSCGEGKQEMVRRILDDREDLPATQVRPHHGQLYWYLDEGAAGLLQNKTLTNMLK